VNAPNSVEVTIKKRITIHLQTDYNHREEEASIRANFGLSPLWVNRCTRDPAAGLAMSAIPPKAEVTLAHPRSSALHSDVT
jgi:hypothetical protein